MYFIYAYQKKKKKKELEENPYMNIYIPLFLYTYTHSFRIVLLPKNIDKIPHHIRFDQTFRILQMLNSFLYMATKLFVK